MRPPKDASFVAPLIPPEKLGEVRDSFTIIGAVNFTARAGAPAEVVAKLQALAREHGADVITLDMGPDYQQQVGIYIPPATTYVTDSRLQYRQRHGDEPVRSSSRIWKLHRHSNSIRASHKPRNRYTPGCECGHVRSAILRLECKRESDPAIFSGRTVILGLLPKWRAKNKRTKRSGIW